MFPLIQCKSQGGRRGGGEKGQGVSTKRFHKMFNLTLYFKKFLLYLEQKGIAPGNCTCVHLLSEKLFDSHQITIRINSWKSRE